MFPLVPCIQNDNHPLPVPAQVGSGPTPHSTNRKRIREEYGKEYNQDNPYNGPK